MTSNYDEERKETFNLWEFIPLSNYSRPPKPLEESVRQGVRGLIQKFRSQRESDYFLKEHKELTSFSKTRLNRLVPQNDWKEAAEALNDALDEWFKSDPSENNVVFLICPPSSEIHQVLPILAEERKISHLDPPSPEELLQGDSAWVTKARESLKEPFIISNLEKFFLRHVNGLKLVRELLQTFSSTPCKGIIGVDSWAWTYFKLVFKIETFARVVLVVRPFDHQRLDFWFKSFVKRSYKRNILFRQTNTGNYVLSAEEHVEITKTKFSHDNNYLRNLAGYSHGIPFITWNIWRDSLRTTPDDELLKDEEIDEESKRKQWTIWVLPWGKVDIPPVPESLKRNESLVLQALLLHNGLPFRMMPYILPFSENELNQHLNRLKRLNLIEINNGEWKVRPIAYPRIRDFLSAEGYLVEEI